MNRLIRSLALSGIIMLVLASCNMNSLTSAQNPLLVTQSTPSLPQLAKIDLAVQADTSLPFNTVGQPIKYTYDIKNTGSTILPAGAPGQVAVTGATVNCPDVNTVGNHDTNLDPNEKITCSSSYSITQADLDKGSVTNVTTATVSGILSNTATTTVQFKVLTLTTTANPLNYNQVGQQITYTYVIKNSGSVNMGPAQFTVSDSLLGAAPINCGDANTSLAPNATVTCTAKYTITQADLNSTTVSNIATASGGGAGQSQSASTTINKTAVAQNNPSNLPPGTTIQHTVSAGEWLWQIARCYGADPNKVVQANPQLANPAQITPNTTVTVPNIGSAGTIYGPPCVVIYTVQSGDTWASIAQQYNADLVVMQRVNSNTLSGQIIVPRNSAGGTTTVSKGLGLTTTANPLNYDHVGQTLTYTYVIKNTGSVTLGPAQFTVSDGLIGSTPFSCGNSNTSLAPNATVTCTATHAITQADLNSASISNIASASGGGAGPSQSASVTINKVAKVLSLTTIASPLTYDHVGQTITYTYVIKNGGTLSLGPAQFTVSDSLIGPTAFTCGNANTSLAPNATLTCTAVYLITQADLNSATVSNLAAASGGGAGPTQTASVTINKVVNLLTLTTAANPLTYNQVGQTITYTYVIKNSGTLSLGPAQFTVSDTLIGSTPFNCGASNTTLAPNATVTCTATYTLTQADLGSATVTNLATASGGGAGPSQSASVTVNKQ